MPIPELRFERQAIGQLLVVEQRRLDAARHVGHHCDPHSQRRGHPHAEADLRWRIAFVCVHATAQHQRSLARHGAIEESARMASHCGLGKARKLGVVEGAHLGEAGRGRSQTRAEHDGHLSRGSAQVLANRLRSHQHAVMKAGR